MNNNSITVGIIIGLLIFFLGWISQSNLFNKSQKITIIILSILFFPGGILLSLIIYLINQSNNKINTKETLEYKLNLLKETFNSGIITEEEYISKKKLISTPNDNSSKLLELYNTGLLTKDEYEAKGNVIKRRINHTNLKSKQLLSVVLLFIILIISIICLILVIQNNHNNTNSESVSKEVYVYDESSKKDEEIVKDLEIINEVKKNEIKVEPTSFVFYSSSIDDRNKPIAIRQEYSLYEQKTVCTKIYEIKNSAFYQFDERMKDYMLSIHNINSSTAHKYNDYKQAYDKKNILSEGVIETSLFDLDFSEYSK